MAIVCIALGGRYCFLRPLTPWAHFPGWVTGSCTHRHHSHFSFAIHPTLHSRISCWVLDFSSLPTHLCWSIVVSTAAFQLKLLSTHPQHSLGGGYGFIATWTGCLGPFQVFILRLEITYNRSSVDGWLHQRLDLKWIILAKLEQLVRGTPELSHKEETVWKDLSLGSNPHHSDCGGLPKRCCLGQWQNHHYAIVSPWPSFLYLI